jgi:Fe-S-cluster containining protein
MRTFSLSPLARPAIEKIWIEVASQLGLHVERTAHAYASSDGNGRILIGRDEILDADDAAAQLIFHELCHALVEGPARWSLPDWGLDNSGAGDVSREHACLRLQAHLAAPHDLRELLAPTTEYRAYHDRLPTDPLLDDGDPSVSLARAAVACAMSSPWGAAIDRALALTSAQLREDRAPAAAGTARHPLGFALGHGGESCGTCAWSHHGGRGKPVLRCRQSAEPRGPSEPGGDGSGRRIRSDFPACERWEPPVDCRECGACCREAYHSVTVSVRDPVVWRQPALIVRHGHRFEILREGDRCAALVGEDDVRAPTVTGAGPDGRAHFRCSIYADRPQACRDFEAGGRHCLDARRRVGLSH